MDILRRAFTDAKLRFHISKVLSAESAASTRLTSECLGLTEQHPDLVVAVLRDNLNYANSEQSCAYLLLLERLVGSCSSSFHAAMARDYALHEKLVMLAVGRAEGDDYRRARRLARLTLLEYSRMFADEPELHSLSLLASIVEKRTGRHLMRAIEVENKTVCIIEPRPEDIVLISPIERTGNSFSKGAAPSAWACHMCTYINKATSRRCLTCKSAKPAARTASPPRGRVINGHAVQAGETIAGALCCAEVDDGVRCRTALDSDESMGTARSAESGEDSIISNAVEGIDVVMEGHCV